MLIETLSTFPAYVRLGHGRVHDEASPRRRASWNFAAHDLRDWTHDRHRTTDDDPYGGGAGLVMKCDPIFEAVEAILGKTSWRKTCRGQGGARRGYGVRLTERVPQRTKQPSGLFRRASCLSESGAPQPRPRGSRNNTAPKSSSSPPRAAPSTTPTPDKLAAADHLLFICGHYEGIDERVYTLADHVISLGDYVLTIRRAGLHGGHRCRGAQAARRAGGGRTAPVDESFTERPSGISPVHAPRRLSRHGGARGAARAATTPPSRAGAASSPSPARPPPAPRPHCRRRGRGPPYPR